MNEIEAFSQYVTEAGGRAEAAKKLGITAGMVGHVLNGVRSISIERAKEIESQTGGRITRHDLRRDVFGPPPGETDDAEAA